MHSLSDSPRLKQPVPKFPVPLKFVALGDSLVYGYGDPEGGGWVDRLRRQWMHPDHAGPILYNLGVRGDTVKHVARRLESEFRYRGELRHQVPDRIILSVGVNDSARLGRPDGRCFTPFSDFQVQLAELLDRAVQLCPVLFVGMVPVNEAAMPFLEAFYYNHADQHLYNEATRLACHERQIPYLDIFDLWQHRGENWCQQQLSSDGLHPNSQGYQSLLADIYHWHPIQSAQSA
ncbi:GDSL-type esterase/lipase family protein [Acaryochloris sp. IP29b_bin.148]|uniref:GDSL-type esterase/lipase family protein n=1 Tax=Acaryochloris sp. IP29b_bin.148 TaxID=2969218 RepID=UPI002636B262|nr:GDSL-type esterase/lipase family protein [Acaryochloris sp. IP29b_bin.148]